MVKQMRILHKLNGFELWRDGIQFPGLFARLRDLYDAYPRAAFASIWTSDGKQIETL